MLILNPGNVRRLPAIAPDAQIIELHGCRTKLYRHLMTDSRSNDEVSPPRRALICGVSGQDGSYLARLLLEKGYEVFGTSRDAQMSSFRNLRRLGIDGKVRLESMAVTDFRSVLQALRKTQPDEVYNLAGQTSVGLSFQQPVETLESTASAR